MKTAISVPDETFERAERVARKHGMKRSRFYATAVDRYSAELESADLTAAIDAVVDAAGIDESSRFAVTASRRRVNKGADEW
jgi:predicted DNA-binding protein